MGERHDRVREHVERIANRSDDDALQLARALRGRSWPTGPEDRTIPWALIALRHWRPSVAKPRPPQCSCATGYCAVCN
jgi:hypothetical protein